MTWETILNLIHDEWMILLLLLLWSVAGVTIICERVYALWNVLAKSEAFKNQVIGAIESGDLPKAHAFCETGSFKRYLWALGTVGSSAPFVGLFGTVVGILKAFQSMSTAGTGGFKVVSQGIAAALVATAAGLLVAIYAIIAYNYFVSRVGAIAVEYKVFCEEFLLVLGEYARTREVPPAVAGAAPPPAKKDASPS